MNKKTIGVITVVLIVVMVLTSVLIFLPSPNSGVTVTDYSSCVQAGGQVVDYTEDAPPDTSFAVTGTCTYQGRVFENVF